jgi:Spy/CpxP family protein refolding chaperone
MGEDLTALWNELKLTPKQADALETVHKLVTRYRQNRHVQRHDEWRADLAGILTSGQLALAESFHEKQMAKGGSRFLKAAGEREMLHDQLGLTGEQKISLVQMVLDRRGRIVPSIQSVLTAAGNLHELAHSDTPDRQALMAASASLGQAIAQAAETGAEIVSGASAVLTARQMDLIKEHINNHLDRHLELVRGLPAKVHEFYDFLNELALTAEQKDQVVKLIAEKHKAHRARHHGMKGLH